MTEYRIALCDDEAAARGLIRKEALSWADGRGCSARVFEFASACAVEFAREDGGFDIMLLDVELGVGENGVELARALRKSGDHAKIIFITGYPEFIAEGYEVSAVSYLIKPVSREKLFAALDRAADNIARRDAAVRLRTDGGELSLLKGDIICAEAEAHLCRLTTAHGEVLARMGISELEKALGSGFVRCHRSCIAALKYVRRVTRTEVLLDGGGALPLSRTEYAAVNRAFIGYYGGGEA